METYYNIENITDLYIDESLDNGWKIIDIEVMDDGTRFWTVGLPED